MNENLLCTTEEIIPTSKWLSYALKKLLDRGTKFFCRVCVTIIVVLNLEFIFCICVQDAYLLAQHSLFWAQQMVAGHSAVVLYSRSPHQLAERLALLSRQHVRAQLQIATRTRSMLDRNGLIDVVLHRQATRRMALELTLLLLVLRQLVELSTTCESPTQLTNICDAYAFPLVYYQPQIHSVLALFERYPHFLLVAVHAPRIVCTRASSLLTLLDSKDPQHIVIQFWAMQFAVDFRVVFRFLLDRIIALLPLCLPPYVLLEVFDWLPLMQHVEHKPKIDLIIAVRKSAQRVQTKKLKK